jgi:hypothetical protein
MIAILFATLTMTACGANQTEAATNDSTLVDSTAVDSAQVGDAITDSTAHIK